MREKNDLFIVMKKEMKLPLLTKEQEKTASKKELMEHNLRLVAKIADRYCGGNPVLLLDLFQEGFFGLEKAAEKFDRERGCRFSTYAVWWIRQAILRALLNLQRTVSLKTNVPEMLVNFKKACRKINQESGRTPRLEEIAEEMEVSEEKVAFIISVYEADISLDHPFTDSIYCQRPLMEYFLTATDNDMDDDIARMELAEKIDQILHCCDEREKEVLKMRLGIQREKSETLEVVGNQFNLSKERIRQIQKTALEKLKQSEKVIKIASQFELSAV